MGNVNVRSIESQIIYVHGKPVTLTNETINKTCDWYANNAQGCIDEAASGEQPVNDLESYRKEREADKARYLSGDFKIWLGFWQKALFLQNGQCVGILG